MLVAVFTLHRAALARVEEARTVVIQRLSLAAGDIRGSVFYGHQSWSAAANTYWHPGPTGSRPLPQTTRGGSELARRAGGSER